MSIAKAAPSCHGECNNRIPFVQFNVQPLQLGDTSQDFLRGRLWPERQTGSSETCGFPGQRPVKGCPDTISGLILFARSRTDLSARVRTAEELECRGEIRWTLSYNCVISAAKASI